MRLGVAKESGSFASLSASLLARKGQARPAMRPSVSHHDEDLGWNDMGHEPSSEMPVPVQYQEVIAAKLADPVEDAVEDIVEACADIAPPPAEVTPRLRVKSRVTRHVKVRKSVQADKGLAKAKVAFTLRLDGDRHLRLRLGCTIANRSAQQIVTEALDVFLASIPGIEELAAQIPPPDMNRQR